MNINKVILVGRLSSDIMLSSTANGSMARFSLATNRVFKGKDGLRKEETCYHNSIIAWDTVAETIAKFVKRGDEFGISGRLNDKSIKQEDGSYKNYSQVVVEEFYFGEKKKEPVEINDKEIEEAINNATNEEVIDIPF